MSLTLVVAQFVLARAFGRDPSWRDLRAYSIVSGGLTLALLVLFVAGPIDGGNGLLQRAFLAGAHWSGSRFWAYRLRNLAYDDVALPATAT